MNELAEVKFQLPNTIDDLVKWDVFYSARIPIYKKLLKKVKSWDEASEEELRILRRAQEEGENLIDIHVMMGELYKNLPETKGGDHGNQYVGGKESTTGPFAKTPKQEYKEQTGLSDSKAKRFALMFDNPEIVAEVKAEARKNDEIPTQTEILKRIEEEKNKIKKQYETQLAEKDETIKQLKHDGKKREEYIGKLEKRDSADYDSLKTQVSDLQTENNELRLELKSYKETISPASAGMDNSKEIFSVINEGYEFIARLNRMKYSDAFRRLDDSQPVGRSFDSFCNMLIECINNIQKTRGTVEIIDVE